MTLVIPTGLIAIAIVLAFLAFVLWVINRD